MSHKHSKTVQEYIDETPNWSDGTLVTSAPMTTMQWRIWALATAGKFFEGLVIFMTGVALPLMALEFHMKATQVGLASAASLFGILVGATALGGLSDLWGRKLMFILEMALFTAFLTLVAASPSFGWMLVFLFGMGLALGCDYPTAHLVISESIPSHSRGRLVLSAFGFQAVGALAGTGVGFLILKFDGSISDWRAMYATAIIPAILVTIGRFFVTQSSHWLAAQGRYDEAARELEKLLRRDPQYPQAVNLHRPEPTNPLEIVPTGIAIYGKLFSKKKRRRATILASIPWFLQDISTYGIGIFTPIILSKAVGATNPHARDLAEVVYNAMVSAKGAAVIDMLLIVGIIAAIALADRVGRIKLQILGFIGCAIGLALAAVSEHTDGSTRMFFIFAGFMVFNFMTNLGPNAMTYLIAGEVFPTKVRGIGAGFAASVGKIGAVATAFLFPIMLKDIGITKLLSVLVCSSLLGAWITWRFGIETKGINLEKMDGDAD